MIRRPATLLTLLACALLAGAPLSLAAQKSTIQGSRGGSVQGSRGGSIGAGPRSGGGIRASQPPARVSRPEGPARTGSLSPAFPLKGRADDRGIVSRPSPSSSGRGGSVLHPAGEGRGKGYLRSSDARPGGSRQSWIDRDRWRRDRDGVRYIVYDPFFYDPYYRYRYFDRYRYAYGFGCGSYDRFFLGHHGRAGYGYDPCFSAFSLSLGYPWFADPWPGFWGYGYSYAWPGTYGYRGGSDRDGERYEEGYDEGFSRGYREGQRQDGDEAYETGYGSQLAPGVQPAFGGGGGGGYGPDAGLPVDPGVRERLAAGDYESALRILDGMVDDHPGDAAAHLTRGLTLVALGHYGKAAEAFRDGLDTGRPVPLRVDAPALFPSRAEYRRVVAGLEGFVRGHADHEDARFALGAVYLFSGETDRGRALLRGLSGDPHARALLDGTAVVR
ncbi:MAG: tetratricopeptide repeat protein [Gemmatimonadota bacterium]